MSPCKSPAGMDRAEVGAEDRAPSQVRFPRCDMANPFSSRSEIPQPAYGHRENSAIGNFALLRVFAAVRFGSCCKDVSF